MTEAKGTPFKNGQCIACEYGRAGDKVAGELQNRWSDGVLARC